MPYLKYKRRGRRGRRSGVLAQNRRAGQMNRKASNQAVTALSKKISRIDNRIKKQVEVKEYYPATPLNGTVGQVDANATGARGFDLSALNIPQGVGANERVGNIVKCIGLGFRFQVTQQSACELGGLLVFDFWRTPDLTTSLTSIIAQLYDNDSISGVVDANGTRYKDYIKSKTNPHGIHTLLSSRSKFMPRDIISTTQAGFFDFKHFIKQNVECTYAGASSGVPQNVRYFIVVRAQQGNRSTTTASTLTTLPTTAINTGYLVRLQHTGYYVDM